jgi:hypothetical protein
LRPNAGEALDASCRRIRRHLGPYRLIQKSRRPRNIPRNCLIFRASQNIQCPIIKIRAMPAPVVAALPTGTGLLEPQALAAAEVRAG